MKFLDFFKTNKRSAAMVAKERLQIIVSHESARNSKDFIKDLQRELLEVIGKYVDIDPDHIKVQLEQHGDQSVLELNVTLPEQAKAGLQATQVPKPKETTNPNKEAEQPQTNEAQADKSQETAKASEQA